jgi:hypothetical protein
MDQATRRTMAEALLNRVTMPLGMRTFLLDESTGDPSAVPAEP